MADDEAAVNSEDEAVDLPAETDQAPQRQSGSAPVTSLAQAMAKHGALADSIRQLTGDLERIAPFANQQAKLAEQVKRNFSFVDNSAFKHVAEQATALNAVKPQARFMGTLAESFRRIDRITKNDWLLPQQAVVANWTQVTLGSSALTSWRASLEAQTRVSKMFVGSQPLLAAQFKLIQDLKRITATQVSLTDWAVRHDAGSRLLGEISGKPLGLWRTYVNDLSTAPNQEGLELSVATGEVGLGLLAADMVGSAAADTQFEPEAVERVQAEVLEPWRQGRLDSTEQLYVRLGTIDATVPELLKGAWDNVLRNGPAAASQAAYCVTEVLDRTLRAAAPDDEVRAWHTATGRPAAEWENQDRPPRSLRVKFLAQRAGGTRKLVVAQYESLATLVQPLQGRLQGVKHASTGEVALVCALLQTTESFLTVLFMTSES